MVKRTTKRLELTEGLERILGAAAAPGVLIGSGNPQDPELTALVAAGYLEVPYTWLDACRITPAGRARLKNDASG